MAKYHLYCLDDQGRIRNDEWFDAATDDQAVAAVKAMKKPHACEIWDRDRMLAHVPAYMDA
jgi:hypothetical protein